MKVGTPYFGSPEPEAICDDEEDLSNLPPSTRRHRRNGRQSRKQRAIKQQYLTPQEENVVTSVLAFESIMINLPQ